MKADGSIMLIMGLLMTIFSGFRYITNEKVLVVGEQGVLHGHHNPVDWQPFMGIGVMVIGGTLFTLGSKRPTAHS